MDRLIINIVDGQVTMVNVPDGFSYQIEVRDYDVPKYLDRQGESDSEDMPEDEYGDKYVPYMVRY